MKKRSALFIFCWLLGHVVLAQPKQIGKYFPAATGTGGPANVQYLIDGYISPLGEDLGSLINNGWYHTGENHKKFGFDLSISVNTIFASDASKHFTIDNTKTPGIGFTGTATPSGIIQQAPTAYGPEAELPGFAINNGPNAGLNFIGPGGGNISSEVPIGSMAVPTIQGGLGLVKNTDIRFRYTPAVDLNGTKLGNWGVGLLHDIKQHIPGIKLAPFSLGLLVTYSQLNATTSLEGLYQNAAGSGSFTGQEGVGETSAYSAQILIAKSIPVLTFYGGIGYNSATTKYAVKGNYYVDNANGVPLIAPFSLTDPFQKDYSTSGFRATGGLRIKFGPIFLNGDYTLFRGNGHLTVGFGLTVR